MDLEFWRQRWLEPKQGFQLEEEHPFLHKYWSSLMTNVRSVLVPLCGKTPCLDFLLEQKLEVMGVELSEIPVKAYFVERKRKPKISQQSNVFSIYQDQSLNIYCGDYFHFQNTNFDAFYDRAALIALPLDQQRKYLQHTAARLSAHGLGFVITITHSAADGPPFSVSAQQLEKFCENIFSVQHIFSKASNNVPNGKGAEHLFLLTKLDK